MNRLVPLSRLACAVALFASFGCATLAGRRQYVSIDSQPRGLEVLDPADDSHVLGTTPLFLHLPRRSSYDLHLRRPGGQSFSSHVDCGFRWKGALLGNLPLGLILPPAGIVAYGAGNAVDLVTGAAWECPWRARPAAPGEPEKPADCSVSPACPRYVVLPPELPDEKLSDLVAERWRERLAAEGGCGKLADEQAAKSWFRRYNVTHDGALDPREAEPGRLNELGFLSGATHAVVLAARDDGSSLHVEPRRVDLHDLSVETERPFDIDLAGSGVSRSGVLATVARYLRFLPNSIAFSADLKDFQFEGAQGGVVRRNEPTRSVLPSVLSNWTVGWVEHPDQHGAWDATFALSPVLVFGYNARNLEVANGDGGEARSLEVALVHGVVLYGAQAGLHTPLGAFGLQLALGGGFAWTWEDGAFLDWTWRGYGNARLDYTAFVSENLFLQVAVESYASGPPHATGDRWQLTRVVQESITLGYYLPQIRSFVRGLF